MPVLIEAVNYTAGPRRGPIELVVIHDMEMPETARTAELCARYFANQPRGPAQGSSAHYCIDGDTIVQCVLESNIAWAAPGANHNGIQLEHAGYARQTRDQWLDPYSRSMLTLSALLTAEICRRYSLPATFVDAAALVDGKKGITTHRAVSAAFRKSSHTDPGVNFPMDYYLAAVQEALKPKVLRKWPVPLPDWFWSWATWRLQGQQPDQRPSDAPLPIPLWAWTRLSALLAARE